MPTNTATIYTLRSHIEKLAVKGFRPDMILIDYADIMRSTRQYDSLRHELKLIYQELRSYAAELGIPYAGIALVTDYDAGVDGHEPVTLEAVFAMMHANVANVRRLIEAALPALP